MEFGLKKNNLQTVSRQPYLYYTAFAVQETISAEGAEEILTSQSILL